MQIRLRPLNALLRCCLRNRSLKVEFKFEPRMWRFGFVVLFSTDTLAAVWVGPFGVRLAGGF